MEKKYTPCGGCGAEHPDERCLGCFHPFESTPIPEPKIETVTWLNLGYHFTEDWEIMHCRYADDKRKVDTDLFELSDGWLIKKGGTGKLELHEVEYMAEDKEYATGAVWVKASERFPVKRIVVAKMLISYLNKEVVGTASSFNGEMITFDWNISSITLEASHKNWENMQWLDEGAKKEVPNG